MTINRQLPRLPACTVPPERAQVDVLDVGSGAVISSFDTPRADRLVLAADGGSFALLNDQLQAKGRVQWWDLSQGAPLLRKTWPALASTVRLSKDGSLLAFQKDVGEPSSTLVDLAGSQPREHLIRAYPYSDPGRLHPRGRYAVTVEGGLPGISSGSQRLVVSSREGFQLAHGACPLDVKQVTEDGRLLGLVDSRAACYDAATLAKGWVGPLLGYPRQLALSPNEGKLLVRDNSGLQVLDSHTGQVLGDLRRESGGLGEPPRWFPDSRRCALLDGRRLVVLDTRDMSVVFERALPGMLTDFAVHSESGALVVASADPSALLTLDPSSGEVLSEQPLANLGACEVELSEDGRRAVVLRQCLDDGPGPAPARPEEFVELYRRWEQIAQDENGNLADEDPSADGFLYHGRGEVRFAVRAQGLTTDEPALTVTRLDRNYLRSSVTLQGDELVGTSAQLNSSWPVPDTLHVDYQPSTWEYRFSKSSGELLHQGWLGRGLPCQGPLDSD